MNKRTIDLLEKHFDTAFAAPDGIKKLRELILTLAMQGRLVPQDPNDQPASELLKEIEAEKQRLVKEGKIKKPKPLPPISEKEKPYALPRGWEWVKLGILTSYKYGKTPPSKNSIYWDDNGGLPWASISDLPIRGHIDKTTKRVSLTAVSDVFKYEPVQIGSLLMSFKLSIGKTAITEIRTYHNEAIISFDGLERNLKMWLYWILYPISNSGKSKKAIKGSTLNSESIGELLIPVPPTAEQHRIVTKIDELMARCDELEKLRTTQQEKRLTVHTAAIKQLLNITNSDQHLRALGFLSEHFGELYTVKENVAELRKAILQLAVMGKLVPQDPNDQPASVLLKEIEAEKQRLVKEGKIKKSKQVPSISQDNEPFLIPDNWRWVRIAELAESIDYGTSQKTCDDSSLVPVYRMGNIVDGRLIEEGFKYISPEIEELPRLFLQPNDILFNRTNSYELVGKSALYTGKIRQATFASYLIRVRLFGALLNPVFMSLTMNSRYFRFTQIEPEIVQQCGQANFNGTKLSLCVVPLPPLVEQHRIVAKIDELMALCDSLDQQIDAATNTQTKLLNALMHVQSQGKTEEEIRQTSLSKAQVIHLATYRAAIGCYAVNKLANAQYFGRTAAAKVLYLAQAHVGLALDLKPERQAAGPLDTWIYEFERQGQSQQWFDVHEKTLASGRQKTEYRCLPALSKLVTEAEALMSPSQKSEFDRLIYALAGKKTEEVEIIATLFAVWNDSLIDGVQPTDQQIISDFRENWHERKARFTPAELSRWLDWLRRAKIIPQGLPPRTVQQTRLATF